MFDNTEFILTPIAEILRGAVKACGGLGEGIETYPLKEYVFQTTFLKLTGALEQKMKCIIWEIATYDYDYRYEVLKNTLNECSSYDDKNKVFKDILEHLGSLEPHFKIDTVFNNKAETYIIGELQKVGLELKKSIFFYWDIRNNNYFLSCLESMKPVNIFPATQSTTWDLYGLKKRIPDFYKNTLYPHRNSCAHNLKSYQTITPSLTSLAKNGNDEINYFKMFFVLILLDEIFIRAFDEYVRLRETAIF